MIYKRIKELREDNDFTQQQLADYLHITRSAYQNYECGARGISIEVLSRIADFYHTSMDYLTEKTDVKKPYLRK